MSAGEDRQGRPPGSVTTRFGCGRRFRSGSSGPSPWSATVDPSPSPPPSPAWWRCSRCGTGRCCAPRSGARCGRTCLTTAPPPPCATPCGVPFDPRRDRRERRAAPVARAGRRRRPPPDEEHLGDPPRPEACPRAVGRWTTWRTAPLRLGRGLGSSLSGNAPGSSACTRWRPSLVTRSCASPERGDRCGLAAVAIDPLRESAQRVLIEAYLAEGNLSEAHRQLDAYGKLLMGGSGSSRRRRCPTSCEASSSPSSSEPGSSRRAGRVGGEAAVALAPAAAMRCPVHRA